MATEATITLIQFRDNPLAGLLEYESIKRELGQGVVLNRVCIRTPEDELLRTTQVSDGVILGGSGDYDFDGKRPGDDEVRRTSRTFLEKLKPILSYLHEVDKPLFGICFGHQILGAFHGVSVHHDETQSKLRSHEVTRIDGSDHPYLQGVPLVFTAQYGHKDVLDAVPAAAHLLGHGGEWCRVSMVAYSNRIVSTQFHPELSLEDMHRRVEHIPSYLPEGAFVEELFVESPHAHRILRNFALECRGEL